MIQNGNPEQKELLEERRELVHMFTPELVANIAHPEHMIPYLQCLTLEEENEIRACKDMHGDQQAVMKMLFFLVLKGPEMYGQLVNALEKTKSPGKLVQDLKDMMDSDSFSDLPSEYRISLIICKTILFMSHVSCLETKNKNTFYFVVYAGGN